MLVVGLTGGIASGKTTVSNLFAKLQVEIIDTDIISRELLQPDGLGYKQVIKHFGINLLDDNKIIDRQKLRKIIFTDSQQKIWLETMLHPLIYQECHRQIKKHTKAKSKYLMFVVPLLFETNFQSLVDRICVVSCTVETQLQRLLKRDNIDRELAEKMISQQLSNHQRVSMAHDVIDNQQQQTELLQQVKLLHESYLILG